MICDKCGKSIVNGLSECSYCGAKVPNTMNCGGFTDILSFHAIKEHKPSFDGRSLLEGEDEKEEEIAAQNMQKLLKKLDDIINLTRKNTFLGFIGIVLGFAIVFSSIVVGIITIFSINEYNEEIMTQVTETKKELEEYKTEIDTIIATFDKTNNDDAEDLDKTGNN